TGSWEGAGWGAVGGAAAYLGGAIGSGIFSQLRGGRFVEGFLETGLSSYAGIETQGLGGFTGALVRTVAAAVIGGTASVIGGGKFEDGAATAGFAALFIEEAGAFAGFARRETDRLKLLSCSQPGAMPCSWDDRGELDTAGGRDPDWTHNPTKATWGLSRQGVGMGDEGECSAYWKDYPTWLHVVLDVPQV